MGALSLGRTQRFREVQQAMQTLFLRRLVLSVLLFTLLVPPGELSAWAQDKDKTSRRQQLRRLLDSRSPSPCPW